MNRNQSTLQLKHLFTIPVEVDDNFLVLNKDSQQINQAQTNKAFSEKWRRHSLSEEKERAFQYQKDWYLNLYGFSSVDEFASYLHAKPVIFDAGCGLGYKAAWFAELAPDSLVIGMDFSDAAHQAARTYGKLQNLFFIKGDIGNTGMASGCCDYTNCDQVIMHTENPESTFSELARITNINNGELACYFYAKKALPRELLDEHFRIYCHSMSHSDLWAMSEQLTELGKRLSDLNVSFDCPDIPALGIRGGNIDVQRFIYWNFIKCFWNSELGFENSVVTNFDWYSPSNARRFTEEEVKNIAATNNMIEVFFHVEEACYSGRFTKTSIEPETLKSKPIS